MTDTQIMLGLVEVYKEKVLDLDCGLNHSKLDWVTYLRQILAEDWEPEDVDGYWLEIWKQAVYRLRSQNIAIDNNIDKIVPYRKQTMLEQVIARCVEKIVADLTDRGGLGNEWEGIDLNTQNEIKEEWANIIKTELEQED